MHGRIQFRFMISLALLLIFSLSTTSSTALYPPQTLSGATEPVTMGRNGGQRLDSTKRIINDQPEIQDAFNVEYIGQIGGVTFAVAVRDNYAYIGVGPCLVILDISNPSYPEEVGKTLPLPDMAQDIVVAGDYLYVADNNGGLRIVNIANPIAPVEVGFSTTPGLANGVAVAGDYAYVADDIGGLRIVNITNPTAPVEVGFSTTPAIANDVEVVGDYAYVVGYDGLGIMNVVNPASPVEVGFYYYYDPTFGVAVVDDYAYVVDNNGSLRIVNVSNPASPFEVGSYDTSGTAYGVKVAGDYAYMVGWTGGIWIINIANPGAPVEVGFCDTPGASFDIVVVGGYAFVADDWGGLRIVDVANATAPVEVGWSYTSGTVYDVVVTGDYAYIVDYFDGLKIISIANSAVPVEVGFYDTPGGADCVVVDGDYAYICDGVGDMRIVNVANPAAPEEVGFYDTTDYAYDVAVAGSYAYVAAGYSGLRIVNISNPLAPVEVGFYDTPELANGVVLNGSYAYIADGSGGLRIINVANPAAPVEVGFYYTTGYASGVVVSGDYAYISEGILQIVNVANPAAPFEVGVYEPPYGIIGVALAGDYVYVSQGYYGFRIVNIANPAVPIEVGSYDTTGYSYNVAVVGDYAYVADSAGGLIILRYTGVSEKYSISGNITEPFGSPFEGVEVTAGPYSAISNSQGNYTISNVITGTYSLVPTYSGYTFLPSSRFVSVPPDATGVDFIGKAKPRLKLLIVPLNWQNTQEAFDAEAQLQISFFLNELPLNVCRNLVFIDTLDVETQNFENFTCSLTNCGVNTIRTFVQDELNIDPADYDVIIGLAETSPCAPTMGCSNGTDTIWVTSEYDSVTAHELGHIYQLTDEYCSNQAGSTDQRCNDGDIQGDGAASGDVNWLDSNLPCDCPPNGSNDSGGSPCCNFGGNNCNVVNYGVCCLGNKNNAGGRSTMSYANAPVPRGFDIHDLDYLSSLPELSCGPQANLLEPATFNSDTEGYQSIVDINLLVHPDDTVTEENISIHHGRPTSNSVLAGMTGDYAFKVVDKASNIIWSHDFGVYFDYEGPMVLGVDYSGIAYDAVDVSLRIPHTCGMKILELYHNEELIFLYTLPPGCSIFLPIALNYP